MSIATKNGSVIVKDGSVGTDCGCCGGWYCCAEKACLAASVSSVVVDVSATDYLAQYEMVDNLIGPGTPYKSSAGFLGSLIAGTRTLSQTSPGTWETTYSGFPTGCESTKLTIAIGEGGYNINFPFDVMYYHSQTAFKSLQDMTCGASGSFCSTKGGIFHTVGWPVCVGIVNTLTHSAEWESHRALVDAQIAQYGASANSYSMLAANRECDEKYGASITSVVQRSGSPVISIVVTIQ